MTTLSLAVDILTAVADVAIIVIIVKNMKNKQNFGEEMILCQ